MANTKDFFLTVTQRIFSNWTALKMAVEHGMGTKDRAVDFCYYMTEVMYMNVLGSVDSSEIASELEDYMDEEFGTELQDNSALQVAEELVRFHRYCMENNESAAVTELEKLPPLQLWIVSNEPPKRIRDIPISQDSSSSENEEEPKEKSVDEWTEVKSRRQR